MIVKLMTLILFFQRKMLPLQTKRYNYVCKVY